MAIAFLIYLFFTPSPAHRSPVIAVGGGYSIELLAKPIHPFLAEYHQKINIYHDAEGDGAKTGSVEIRLNTGGRVLIGLYAQRDGHIENGKSENVQSGNAQNGNAQNGNAKNEIVLIQRYGMTLVDLDRQTAYFATKAEAYERLPYRNHHPDWVFLGWISGETYPVKFVPCALLATIEENDLPRASDCQST